MLLMEVTSEVAQNTTRLARLGLLLNSQLSPPLRSPPLERELVCICTRRYYLPNNHRYDAADLHGPA